MVISFTFHEFLFYLNLFSMEAKNQYDIMEFILFLNNRLIFILIHYLETAYKLFHTHNTPLLRDHTCCKR